MYKTTEALKITRVFVTVTLTKSKKKKNHKQQLDTQDNEERRTEIIFILFSKFVWIEGVFFLLPGDFVILIIVSKHIRHVQIF